MPNKMLVKTTTLPTIPEIEASPAILSTPGKSAKVVRVKEHFAVKCDNGIPNSEAENMRFLAAAGNGKVPVPHDYAAFIEPETNRTFIIMEYIPGDTLQKSLPSFTHAQKTVICGLIREAMV